MANKKYKIEKNQQNSSLSQKGKIFGRGVEGKAQERASFSEKVITRNIDSKSKSHENLYNLYWSDEDNCFICKGIEYSDVIGIGDTEEEAVKIYFELLKEYLKDEKENKLVKNKGGRPRKSNSKLVYNVPDEIKAFIELEAARLNINQGAVVEKIVNFYREANKKDLSKYYD